MPGKSDSLENLLRALPDCFLRISDKGHIVEHISGGEDDPCLDVANIAGKHLSEAIPPAAAANALQAIRKVMRTRAQGSIRFTAGADGVQQEYEMRLIVTGRNQLLAIVRNMSKAEQPGKRSSANSGTTTETEILQRLELAICDARLRERGVMLMLAAFDRATKVRRQLGRVIHSAVMDVARTRIESTLRSRCDGDERSSMAEVLQLQDSSEFAILLQGVEDRESMRQVARRVSQAFTEPVACDGQRFPIAPLIGIAYFPLDGASAEDLLQNARAAQDEARLDGTGCHRFFTDTTRFRVRRRLDVSEELQWAIEKGQLELRYLPRINLEDGGIAGLEALLRWQHPLRGAIPLTELIPLAESTGQMQAVGDWVLDTACAQAAAWREQWREMPPVGINLSGGEFHDEQLIQRLESALDRYQLPAAALEVEISESFLSREEKAGRQLSRLNDLGVNVIIDDVGRGYTSLLNMADLPIRTIKIDRSIVDECLDRKSRGSVCAAIIAMAGHLGLTVVAKGVETIEQINFMREHGCDGLQGFFFTEPLEAEGVSPFLAAHLGTTPDGQVVDLATIRTRFGFRSAS